MAHIVGRDVIFYIDKGAGFVPYVCAVSFSLKTVTETKGILTTGDGNWNKPKAQRKSYQLNFNGVSELPLDPADGYDAFDFLENQCQDTNFQYQIRYTSNGSTVVKMITGEALVVDSDFTAGAEGLMDSTFTCDGFGAYQRFNSASACNATLATLTFSGQTPTTVILAYTGLTGSDRLEYSVDGQTRRDLVGMPANGDIIIVSGVGIVAGPHTVQVWPVCANGEDGTPRSVNYTKT